jgi:hypothetical protein
MHHNMYCTFYRIATLSQNIFVFSSCSSLALIQCFIYCTSHTKSQVDLNVAFVISLISGNKFLLRIIKYIQFSLLVFGC